MKQIKYGPALGTDSVTEQLGQNLLSHPISDSVYRIKIPRGIHY
jgi:hypothetical protein